MAIKSADILIVGSFYKSAWMASELNRQGWNVLYIDLFQNLGRWPAEDIEGPFGFFSTENLDPYFLEKINFEEPYMNQERGFVLWLPSGPVEFKSALITHHIQKLGIDTELIELLSQSTESFYSKQKSKKLNNLEFKKDWLGFFINSFNSTTENLNLEDIKLNYPIPIMNPFYTRSLSRRSFERSQSWLSHQNLMTSDKTQVIDIVSDQVNRINGLEVKGDYSGVVKFKSLIWGLSSEETYYYSEKLGSLLFPKGKMEAEWVWTRYSLEVAINRETEQLPNHSVWVEDLNSPWTHENLIICQRTTRDELFDSWIKIPASQRFNTDYLKYYGEKILQQWNKRFNNTETKIQHYPQELNYTYKDLGAHHYPIFNALEKKKYSKVKFKNVYFDGYEQWESYHKESIFQHQRNLILELNKQIKAETLKELT